MWLFTRYGFYSIACARKPDGSLDAETVMIRARRSSHLAALKKRFAVLSSAEVITLQARDYRYRVIVPKKVWVKVIGQLAEEQEWSNFKNETADFQGDAGSDYTSALHDTWSVMYRLQE
jgi:hypothetical protein